MFKSQISKQTWLTKRQRKINQSINQSISRKLDNYHNRGLTALRLQDEYHVTGLLYYHNVHSQFHIIALLILKEHFPYNNLFGKQTNSKHTLES